MTSDTEAAQRFNAIDEWLDRLTGAVDALVTQFLRPLAQQSVENQQAVGRLIERSEQHQEWLDEDRRDLAEWRRARSEKFQQIQLLLDSAHANRRSANERFEAVQSEIRQNQRLLLTGQERLDTMLAEVLSLSRRVQVIEDAA